MCPAGFVDLQLHCKLVGDVILPTSWLLQGGKNTFEMSSDQIEKYKIVVGRDGSNQLLKFVKKPTVRIITPWYARIPFFKNVSISTN